MRPVRFVLLALLGIVALLAAAAAFNTFAARSRQIAVAPIPRAAIDSAAAANRLAEAIRFRTVSNFEAPDQAAASREIVGTYSLL